MTTLPVDLPSSLERLDFLLRHVHAHPSLQVLARLEQELLPLESLLCQPWNWSTKTTATGIHCIHPASAVDSLPPWIDVPSTKDPSTKDPSTKDPSSKENTADLQQLVDRLDVSASLAQQLLVWARERVAEWARPLVDCACLVFVQLQRALLKVVLDLMLIAFDADMPEEVSHAISLFLQQRLLVVPGGGNRGIGGSPFVEQLLAQLQRSANHIYSLAIEEKFGVATATKHAQQQQLNLPAIYAKVKQQQTESTSALLILAVFEELSTLVRMLALLAWNVPLASSQVVAIAAHLKQHGTRDDPTTALIVASLLSSIERAQVSADEHGDIPWDDWAESWKQTEQILGNASGWKDSALRSVCLLQWAILVRAACERDPVLEQNIRRITGQQFAHLQMEQHVETAIRENALEHLCAIMLPFAAPASEQEFRGQSLLTLVHESVFTPDESMEHHGEADGLDAADYAKMLILDLMQKQILTIATRFTDLVRRIKASDEDVVATTSRFRDNGRKPSLVQPPSLSGGHQMESLLDWIATVYRGRENMGVDLLDPRRRSFLKLIYDDRLSVPAKRAYFDALSALATGDRGAQMVYEMLSVFSSTLTWDWIFGALDWYTKEFQQHAERGSMVDILPDDVALLRSLLNLIRSVVYYSPSSRMFIFNVSDAVQRLCALLATRIPKELKAPLLDTIAGFCYTDGVGAGDREKSCNIPWQVWSFLEQLNVVPRTMQGGIIYDLDVVESKDETYPETRAFLCLLCTLLYPFQTAPRLLYPWNSPIPSANVTTSIPFLVPDPFVTFGMQQEPPAVHRYAQYVVQEVFVKLNKRNYCIPGEKWIVADACLRFIERALFSLEFPTGTSAKTAILEPELVRLVGHPGFLLLCRILSGGPMFAQMLEIVGESVDAVNTNRHQCTAFSSSVKRCLRIFLRVLDVQTVLVSDILPPLRRANDPLLKSISSSLSLARLDELLLRTPKSISILVDFVNCTVDEEIAYLSVKILALLSQSPVLADAAPLMSLDGKHAFRGDTGAAAGNRLVGILEQSDELHRIVAGYVNRLSVEDGDETLPTLEDQDESPQWSNAIRSAIIDFFLDNLSSYHHPPTVPHLLLGYKVRGSMSDTEFQRPSDWPVGTQKTCFFAVLDLLRSHWGSVTGSEDQEIAMFDRPLSLRAPGFIAKLLELVYRLAVDPQTASPTMRYLRYGEDFFYHQLYNMPTAMMEVAHAGVPPADEIHDRIVFYAKQFHQKAWSLKLASLELHFAAMHQEERYGRRLLSLLFRIVMETDGMTEEWMETSGGDNSDEFPRLLELLETSVTIAVPRMSLASLTSTLKHFQGIDLAAFRKIDENGCERYELEPMFARLQAHMKSLEVSTAGAPRGTIDPDTVHEIQAEFERIMNHFLLQNEANELLFSRSHFVRAWKEVVEVSLNQLYSQISLLQREPLLFNLFECVLGKLDDTELHAIDREALCEVALLAWARLRQDRLILEVVRNVATWNGHGRAGGAWSLSTARFQQYFDKMVRCVLSKDNQLAARGNVYAAMLNMLQYVHPSEFERQYFRHANRIATVGSDWENACTASLGGSVASLDGTALGSQKWNSTERRQLLAEFHSILCSNLEPMLQVVCADACAESNDVWKTLALMMLDALILLCRLVGSGSSVAWKSKGDEVTSYLKNRNILRQLVHELQSVDDLRLTEILMSTSGTVADTPMFIFEAKMALFLRIASNSFGAECILESQLFETLSECGFIRQRSEDGTHGMAIDGRMDIEGDMVNREKYHHLLISVLTVTSSVLSSLGRMHSGARVKVSSFLKAHRMTITWLLRDRGAMVTLSSLEELKHLTAIFHFLATDRELMDRQAPESFHALLCKLFAVYLGSDRWLGRLQPIAEDEVEDMKRRYSSNFGLSISFAATPASMLTHKYPHAESLFAKRAWDLVQVIGRNLLGYCAQVAELGREERAGQSVLVRTLFSARLGDALGRRGGGQSVAENKQHGCHLGALGMHMKACSIGVEEALQVQSNLANCLGSIQTLSSTDIQELVDALAMDPDSLVHVKPGDGGLSVVERQHLVLIELERRHAKMNRELRNLYYGLEATLYLMLLHLNTYLEAGQTSEEKDWEERARLGQDAQTMLLPELDRLDVLLREAKEGSDARRNQFSLFLVGKLRDVVMLAQTHGEDEGSAMGILSR